MNCPKCRYDGIRRQAESLRTRLASMAGLGAYRCGGCKHRFYRSVHADSKEAKTKPRWVRRLTRTLRKRQHLAREVALVLLAFAVFLVLMKFLMVERSGPV